MTSLFFVLLVAALFALLLALETNADAGQPRIRQLGLFTWLASGNWPAKVGAGLLIFGIGALMKYAFINVNVTAEAKIASGFIISAAFGAAAFALRDNPQRRAIHLALAGTGFGVAYLTAYSAYGFFHYLNSVNALSLLSLVAISTGIFAVRSNAMSVAVLAMAGAYVAPVFALENAGPLPVYGYYLAVSAISFVMVLLRAWRALIHLGFLFTLVSGIFFGWSARYYQPEYYAIMQPMLLALTALHLAMPLVERRSVASPWQLRFDTGYFICLPVVAVALTWMIAPDWRLGGANGLAMLALLWAIAATALHLVKNPRAFQYAFVASLLVIGAGLCRMHDVPWALVLLGLSVVTLRLAPMMQLPRTAQTVACGAALLFAFLHVAHTIFMPTPLHGFLNTIFAERILAAALLGYAGWIAAQRKIDIAKALTLTAAGWALLAIVAELWRIKLDFVAQIVYGLLIAACFIAAVFNRRISSPATVTTLLAAALIPCGWWAVTNASPLVVAIFLVLTAVALLVLAWRGRANPDSSAAIALAVLPIALLSWAQGMADASNMSSRFWMLDTAVVGAILSLASARLLALPQAKWQAAQDMHFYAIAASLACITLFDIERGVLPVAFELLALCYLAMSAATPDNKEQPHSVTPGIVLVLALTLVLQAMLLRVLGPDGVLTIFDIGRMKLRAVVSLIWVVLGAGLAWAGVKLGSRRVWSAGAALLVVAALKLVLIDFNAMGQLGNILALIAAGLVFLGVAWLAPFPPREQAVAPKPWSGTTASPAVATAASAIPYPAGTGESVTPAKAAATISEPAQNPSTVHAAQAAMPRPVTSSAHTHRPTTTSYWKWILLLLPFVGLLILFFAWQERNEKTEQLNLLREKANRIEQVTQPNAALARAPQPLPAAAPQTINVDRPVEVIKPLQEPVKVSDACTRFTQQLPADYVLYAGGEYKGKPANFQIDQSGHEASRFDVYVNAPGKNVVLALGAYEPSIWNIHYSSGTKIAGVFASGYHKQVVAGIDRNTPVLESSYEASTPCGYFYLQRENAAKADAMMQRLFGKSADTYFIANNGQIEFGLPLSIGAFLQSKDTTVDSYRDKTAPLAGKEGLDQLVREGKLRIATRADLDMLALARQKGIRTPINITGGGAHSNASAAPTYDAYVILAPMRFPAGLFGAHSVTFLLAPNVPQPQGNPGHSRLYDLSSGLCTTTVC